MSGFGRSGRERVKEEMDKYAQLRERDGQISPVKEERWADMPS